MYYSVNLSKSFTLFLVHLLFHNGLTTISANDGLPGIFRPSTRRGGADSDSESATSPSGNGITSVTKHDESNDFKATKTFVNPHSVLDFATRFDLRVRYVYAILVLKLRGLHFPAFLLSLYTEMIRRSQNSFMERCAAASSSSTRESGEEGEDTNKDSKMAWHGTTGCIPKSSKWDFINSFNLLIENMRTRGFIESESGGLPVLVAPKNPQGTLIEQKNFLYYPYHGLHRFAAAAALNISSVVLSPKIWDVEENVGEENFRRWLLGTDEFSARKLVEERKYPEVFSDYVMLENLRLGAVDARWLGSGRVLEEEDSRHIEERGRGGRTSGGSSTSESDALGNKMGKSLATFLIFPSVYDFARQTVAKRYNRTTSSSNNDNDSTADEDADEDADEINLVYNRLLDRIRSILDSPRLGGVVYEKQFYLNKKGLKNLLRYAYGNAYWLWDPDFSKQWQVYNPALRKRGARRDIPNPVTEGEITGMTGTTETIGDSVSDSSMDLQESKQSESIVYEKPESGEMDLPLRLFIVSGVTQEYAEKLKDMIRKRLFKGYLGAIHLPSFPEVGGEICIF